MSPCGQENLLPPLHLVKTLEPPLALDDAGDEALSCRDFSDAVLMPVADIILSAAAVGVLHRQVRARWIELLVSYSSHLAVLRVVNITLFLPSFLSS